MALIKNYTSTTGEELPASYWKLRPPSLEDNRVLFDIFISKTARQAGFRAIDVYVLEITPEEKKNYFSESELKKEGISTQVQCYKLAKQKLLNFTDD